MSTPTLIPYTCWANDAWLEHIATQYPSDEYLHKMIAHIALAEQAWFQRIRLQPVDMDVFRLEAFEKLRALRKSHVASYAEVLSQDQTRIVPYTRLNGEENQSSIADILLHLITHGSHHRGQLASHVSKMKYEVLNTDYINYTRVPRSP